MCWFRVPGFVAINMSGNCASLVLNISSDVKLTIVESYVRSYMWFEHGLQKGCLPSFVLETRLYKIQRLKQ